MKTNVVLLLFLVVITELSSGCSYPMSLVGLDSDSVSSLNGDQAAAMNPAVDPTLEGKALGILSTNCASCHGPSQNAHLATIPQGRGPAMLMTLMQM